jgi:hypothetical protein
VTFYVLTQGEYDYECPVGVFSTLTLAQRAPFVVQSGEPSDWYADVHEDWHHPARAAEGVWLNGLTGMKARCVWTFELDEVRQ